MRAGFKVNRGVCHAAILNRAGEPWQWERRQAPGVQWIARDLVG
jgi:hypothetical protein